MRDGTAGNANYSMHQMSDLFQGGIFGQCFVLVTMPILKLSFDFHTFIVETVIALCTGGHLFELRPFTVGAD